MPTITVDRPEGKLVADRLGAGPPVVLVPGLGDTRGSYRHLAPLLAAAGFTAYSLDLRGHGDSDTTFTEWGPEAIASDVIALLDQEGLAAAAFVGNSISGAAAAWAAIVAPERFPALVLLNPFVRDMPADRFLRPLTPLLFARPWGAAAWMMYRKTLFISPPADQAEVTAAFRATLADPARLAAVRHMIRAPKAGVAARLGEVRARTLVVMGDKDPDYADPAAEGQTVADLIGAAACAEVVANAGHYPQAEHPDRVAALVIAHLGGARGA